MTLTERVAAVETQAADAARLVAAAEAHVAKLTEELAAEDERLGFLEAALGEARHAGSPASSAAVGLAAQAVGAQAAIKASVTKDLEAARAQLAKEQANAAAINLILAGAKNDVLRAEHGAVADPSWLHAQVAAPCRRALDAVVALKGALREIDTAWSRAAHAEAALRGLGVHLPALDVVHKVAPLLEAMAEEGKGPGLNASIDEVRNRFIVRQELSPVFGVPEWTTDFSAGSFIAMLEALQPLPAVHQEAWKLSVRAFLNHRNTREVEAQERREERATSAAAVDYVPPQPVPRAPGERPAGTPRYSGMRELDARGADLQQRIAASAARLARKGKP